VLTDNAGPVDIEVPRDRAGTFEPQIVRKRQRRLSGVDEIVLSLYAKGLTTGEISAHFAEIYGASVSKETISRITDKVLEEMTDWSHRPLDARRRCCLRIRQEVPVRAAESVLSITPRAAAASGVAPDLLDGYLQILVDVRSTGRWRPSPSRALAWVGSGPHVQAHRRAGR
jgi:hypothetical protein